MESNLTGDEVTEQNMVFLEDDEDVFVAEDIGDSFDFQEEPIMMLEPQKGLMFDNEDEAVRFYKGYAKRKGFGVVRRTAKHGEDNRLNYFTLACSRQGKAQYSAKNSLRPNPSTRMQCPAKSNFSRRGEKFCITSVTIDHNHLTSPSKARFLRCHKKLDLHAKRTLELNDQAGIRMNKNFGSLVMEAGGYDKLEFGEKECRNYLQQTRRLRLGTGDANAVYQYFLRMQSKDPDFFHVMDVDEDGRLRNVFWADARSRATYESFCDVVTFDTTYLTNKYSMPFAPFVGVNHHGESVLLGCGLLSNEDTDTFEWLFKSWLCCMSNNPPNAIITDQCKAMQNAIEEVFPRARHRWCIWHIMKKIPEKLSGYEKENKADSKSFQEVIPCITDYDFEGQFQATYTNGLNELQIRIDAYRSSHEIQKEGPTSKYEDTMLNKEKVILSPARVRSVGRPPSKRKVSKIDQVVKRLRAKKQQAPKCTNGVSSQKGRKNGRSKSKNGQESNILPTQPTEELQTSEPATSIHIESYIDILQGKKDVMDLLHARLNG